MAILSGAHGLQRSGLMVAIRVLACWMLLMSGAASAAAARLIAQPDIAPRVAAFPRLQATEAQAARINAALAAADRRVKTAAADCRLQSEGVSAEQPRELGWTRKIAIAMHGPRYLAMVTDDYADCGGLHPNADSVALSYDLRTGRPLDWPRLLPKIMVGEVSVETAMDQTTLGVVSSPALKAIYVRMARRAAEKVAAECPDVLRQFAGPFVLWPDAKQGGIVIQPIRLPHAMAACGVPAFVGIAWLRRQGVQPALLAAIAMAHQPHTGHHGE